MQLAEPHLRILALGSFQLDGAAIWQGPPLPVARSDPDGAMAQLGSRLFLPLDTGLCPSGGLELHFDRFKCLNPDGIAKTHPFFRQLSEAGAYLRSAAAQRQGPDELRQALRRWPDLPSLDIPESSPAPTARADQTTLDNILSMVAHGDRSAGGATAHRQWADQIEAIGRRILSHLFNNSRFQRFERTWQGLRLLLQQGVVADANISVSLAPMAPENLEQRLNALTPHLIGDLPGVILLDLAFDNTPIAMERLAAVARWAEMLMVPLIAWVPAAFFQIASWDNMKGLAFVPHHLDGAEYAKFRNIRHSGEGHWLCLTCNRFLLRNAYGRDNPAHQFAFEEQQPPWISPVWALGTLIAQCFAQSGWPVGFSNAGRFQVRNLALHPHGETSPKAAETSFDPERQDQLIRSGISPLTTRSGKDIAFFPQVVTLSEGSLSYQLLLCQVVQFVLWCKDNLPTESHPATLESRIGEALARFSRRSRPAGFAAIEVSAGRPRDDTGRIPLHLRLTPEPAVIPVRQTIELQLDW